jgi:tRNA (mo5U34)-methyltransferase
MMSLSERDLQDFNQAYPWFTGTRLSDGRILGNPARVKQEDDVVIQSLICNFNITPDSSLIEFGCAEGTLTVYLAKLVKRMVAVEVRPRNISALLTRLYAHDIHNVDVWLKDVSIVSPDWGKFDILFHAGVLYHLINPIAHLFSLKGFADQMLLDTHYGTDALGFQRCAIDHGGKRYPGYVYRELGWSDPYSGVQSASCWLPKDVLLDLVREVGYSQVNVLVDHIVTGMPRIILAAKR